MHTMTDVDIDGATRKAMTTMFKEGKHKAIVTEARSFYLASVEHTQKIPATMKWVA